MLLAHQRILTIISPLRRRSGLSRSALCGAARKTSRARRQTVAPLIIKRGEAVRYLPPAPPINTRLPLTITELAFSLQWNKEFQRRKGELLVGWAAKRRNLRKVFSFWWCLLFPAAPPPTWPLPVDTPTVLLSTQRSAVQSALARWLIDRSVPNSSQFLVSTLSSWIHSILTACCYIFFVSPKQNHS